MFRGVGVALVTIFDDDGEIDPGATGKLAGDLVARGMQAVLVCGSTGEAATLTGPERVALIEAVRGTVPPGIPVIAGTGAPSARQAAGLTKDAIVDGSVSRDPFRAVNRFAMSRSLARLMVAEREECWVLEIGMGGIYELPSQSQVVCSSSHAAGRCENPVLSQVIIMGHG